MSNKSSSEVTEYRLDWLKWLLVFGILAAVAVSNSVYADESLLYRVLAGVVLGAFACVIAAQTQTGAQFWNLAKGSRAEVRRVVWPTKTERNRATLMVVLFVAFMSLVLWFLDFILGKLGGWILG